ncbi:ABC transporter permease [Pedobacter sp. JCM 36344]|uniref:ABC transporter permease n=1 Tax=Pedobacter sp. JCM 36344 TaxID=3374280 RepID=UPI0039794D73
MRYRSISLINVVGLAIGISSCLLLLLYISYESSYDKQFKDSEKLYQGMINLYDVDGSILRTIDQTQNVLAGTLKSEFPEVVESARLTDIYPRLIQAGNNSLKLESRYADPEVLNIFDYTFLSGNPGKALVDPNSVVLTESAARKLFGSTQVLNRTVRFEDQAILKVSGVIKDLPANITYNFQALTTWKLFENLNEWPKAPAWGNHNYYTLVKVKANSNIATLNDKLKGLIQRNLKGAKEDIFLYPLTDIHLHGSFVGGQPSGGRIQQVHLFIGLSIGILMIACINFINLSTTNAQKRAKEIGVKKTIGASRFSLILQFGLESLLLTALSILLSVVIVEFSLPWFNSLLGIQIVIDYVNPTTWLLLFGVLIFTGVIAGSYPAFYLSGLSTIKSLKSALNARKGLSLSLRQALVVGQFVFAFVLIIATATIYKQIQYLKNKPLGYKSSGLIEVPHEGLLYLKYDLLKSKLLKSGAILNMTQSSSGITDRKSTIRGLAWEGMSATDKNIDFDQIYTLDGFTETMGIKILAGRDFSRQFASDSVGLLLSEKAALVMRLKEPVGSRILYQGKQCTVIGVFKNIVWGNPGVVEAPMVIAYEDYSDVITMRLNPKMSLSKSVVMVSKVLKELNPNFPAQIKFIDTLNELKLMDETILGMLANLFGGLSVFISCMGLFALSAFSAEQRKKEISIRKVLGATISQLMSLLSSGFLKLVLIGIVIAVPIAFVVMNKWLENFDVRTPLSIWLFLLSAFLTVFIALITVSWQTYKAAVSNPINALKYE